MTATSTFLGGFIVVMLLALLAICAGYLGTAFSDWCYRRRAKSEDRHECIEGDVP